MENGTIYHFFACNVICIIFFFSLFSFFFEKIKRNACNLLLPFFPQRDYQIVIRYDIVLYTSYILNNINNNSKRERNAKEGWMGENAGFNKFTVEADNKRK